MTHRESVLYDPTWLPHRIDPDRGEILFLRCDPDRIAAASFIDGRTDIGVGSYLALPIADLLRQPLPSRPTCRFLFHIGFCGSTLLSRLIEAPGHVRVLREPNIFADLANYRAALDRRESNAEMSDRLVQHICLLLHRPWSPGEIMVVKPSNWANNLLPSIMSVGPLKAIFLTMTRPAFLQAVCRGGSDRLAFAARAAVHLSSRGTRDASQVSGALARKGDDLDRLLALTLVLHAIQQRAFEKAMKQSGQKEMRLLHGEGLRTDPQHLARQAMQTLAVPQPMLADTVAHWSGRNAKAPDQAYSVQDERDADGRAATAIGDRMEAALQWANEALGN